MKEDRKKSDLLDDLRNAREKWQVAFCDFTLLHKQNKENIFCFFEGEDSKYYGVKIKQIFGEKYQPFVCGNKKGVLEAFNKIDNDENYKDVNKMFFIDRDFDIYKSKNDDLYITPTYSIENFYVNEFLISNILKCEYSINEGSPDYNDCIQVFNKMLSTFNEFMVEPNSLMVYQKIYHPKSVIHFDKFKISSAFEVTYGEISKKPDFDKFKLYFNENIEINAVNYNKIETFLSSMNHKEFDFRGKWEMQFLVYFIDIIQKMFKEHRYFKSKPNNPSLEVNNVNCLSILSSYAIYPKSLNDFLMNHVSTK